MDRLRVASYISLLSPVEQQYSTAVLVSSGYTTKKYLYLDTENITNNTSIRLLDYRNTE